MTPRPATGVRDRIVVAAQQAFHERGYHGTSLDEILERAAATKGGLYHHFSDKQSLATAVVDERLRGFVMARWGGADWHEDPVSYLQAAVRSMHPEHLRKGCPVNSMAQEVSFHEEQLRANLESVFDAWIAAIAAGLGAGIRNGTVREGVDCRGAATYFLAVWEGFVALAKTRRDGLAFVNRSIGPLVEWLESLRPSTASDTR
jgi:AcrR family transcriptional regulator